MTSLGGKLEFHRWEIDGWVLAYTAHMQLLPAQRFLLKNGITKF